MRFTYLFFSLLLCLSSYAQPNPINRRAMAIAGLAQNNTDIPSLIGLTISNRWMSTRFCYGSPIFDWIDETNSFHWPRAVGSQSPTNSVLGVYLDASHMLTGTNLFVDANLVWFFIYDWMYDGNSLGNFMMFAKPTSVGGYGFHDGGQGSYTFAGSASPANTVNRYGVVLTNTAYNIIHTGSGNKCYTNGVDTTVNDTWNALPPPVNIGASTLNDSVTDYRGVLKEVIVFTNTTINASQISNLNYYASHYPYSNTTCSGSAMANAVVNDWTNRVSNNGGVLPADATRTALVTFVSGLITDGLDTSMLSVMPFVPDNLIAALTPLYHVIGSDPWVNHNFVSGNLTVNGLVGDSATKYLDSGINTTALPSFTSVAFAVYNYTGDVAADGTWGAWSATDGYDLFLSSGNLVCSIDYSTAGAGRISFSSPSWAGFTIGSRVANNDLKLYTANSGNAFAQKASNTAVVTDQRAAVNKVFNLYAYNNNGTPSAYSGKRLSFFAVTSGFNATQAQNFYNRVQQLRVDLGGGYQ